MKINNIKKIPLLEWVFILVITCWSILYSGYKFGVSDQRIYIPFMKTVSDNSLYPNDLMVSQLNYNPSYFYHFFSYLSSYIPPESLFFFFQFISLFFIFLMIFYLAKLLFENQRIAYITVLLLLIPLSLPGEINTFDIYFSNRNWVMPFLLLSIYMFLKEKNIIAYFLVGLCFNFHPVESVSIFFCYIFYMGFNQQEIKIRKALYALLTFIIFASPLIWWLLTIPSSFTVSTEWIEILKIRNPYLFVFYNWERLMAVISIFLVWLVSLKYYPNRKYYGKIFYFSIAMFILGFISIIFTDLIPFSTLWKMQLIRGTRFFVILAIPFIINLVIHLTLKSETNFSTVISAYGLLLSIFFSSNIFIALFSLFLIISLYRESKSSVAFETSADYEISPSFESYIPNKLNNITKPDNFKIILVSIILTVGGGLLLVVCLSGDFKLLEQSIFSLKNILLMGWLFFAAVLGYLFLKKIVDARKIKIITISALIILMTLMLIPSFGGQDDSFDADWKELQLWCKDNTSKNSTFIIPPDLESFRIWSERSVYGDWKDGALSTFNETYAQEWWKRMTLLGYQKNGSGGYIKGNYSQMNESQFTLIKNSLNSSNSSKTSHIYVVVEKPKTLHFNLVHETRFFRVYELG